jgi:VWFA-related protein
LVVLVVLGLVGGLAVEAQEPAPQGDRDTAGERATSRASLGGPALFRDRIQVYVVNLEVLVTDGEGQPVTGLERDDFVVMEDGQAVEITHFTAIEGGRVLGEPLESLPATEEGEPAEPAVAAPPERLDSLIIFVDDTNLSINNRTRLLSRLRDFLAEHWRDGLRVMLVSNDRDLVIRQGFSTSPREIFDALDQLEDLAVEGSQFNLERNRLLDAIGELNVDAGSGLFHTRGSDAETPQEVIDEEVTTQARALVPEMRAYSQQRLDQVRRSLGVLQRFVDTLAGIPGRKAVLYASDGLPLRPGEVLFEAWSEQISQMAELSATFSSGLESGRYDATSQFEELVADANAAAITFYTLSAAPPSSIRGADQGSGVWSTRLASLEEQGRHDSMRLMADATGGRAALASGVLDSTLVGVLQDFDYRYSLGYESKPRVEGEPRRFRVGLREARRGWDVRYRTSFQDKSADEQAVERTLTALVLPGGENPLGVELEVAEMKAREDGSFEVPLLVHVPLANLVLIPGEAHHEAQVSMYVAARDEVGRTSPVNKHLCPVRIVNSELLVALGRSAACGMRLQMREGSQRLAVSVQDELAQVHSTIALNVEVPPPAAGDPSSDDAAREGDR